jgi:hypothetical protein
MKQELPVVRCVYSESTDCETSLSQLLDESFRLYLARILALHGPDTIQYKR